VQARVNLVHDRDEVLAEHVAQGVHLRHVLQDLVEPVRLASDTWSRQFVVTVMLWICMQIEIAAGPIVLVAYMSNSTLLLSVLLE
jgi:hypothetical protein